MKCSFHHTKGTKFVQKEPAEIPQVLSSPATSTKSYASATKGPLNQSPGIVRHAVPAAEESTLSQASNFLDLQRQMLLMQKQMQNMLEVISTRLPMNQRSALCQCPQMGH